MKKYKLVLSLVLVLVLKIGSVCNQTFHQSPCPDIFSYESDGSSVYGRIVLRGKTPLSRIELQANFAVAGYLSDYGSIEVENARYALQDYNRGLPMQYRVRFTVTSPLPMLTSIVVNGKTICRGQKLVPRPNQVVTNFNLKQTTFQQATGQDFDVVQPQQNPYDAFGGFIIEGQNLSNQDENIFNALNIWSNQAVKEKPTRKPTKPLELQNPVFIDYYSQDETTKPPRPVASNPVQDEEFDGYYPPKQTTRPPQPVTTKRPVQQEPESEPNIECGTRSDQNNRLALVYNGKSYMRGDLPWLVAIYRKKGSSLSFVCGGTLVSDRHVVTAAHCMGQKSERTSMNNIVVKVGVHQLDDWDDEITVTRTLIDATIHESFNSSTLQDDILVLTFSKRVKFNSFIRPACLWNGNTAIQRIVGASGIVAGWGTKKTEGAGVGEPHMINVPIINSDVCRSSNLAFNQISADKSFCAGDRNGNGPCTGDSGGGFYLSDGGKWRLRGIVSFSLRSQDGQCNLNDYVVYTDTAQYLPWIRQALGKQYFD